jgi:hypothetical protein
VNEVKVQTNFLERCCGPTIDERNKCLKSKIKINFYKLLLNAKNPFLFT